MQVEYLIATMNRKKKDFLYNMNLQANAIVINQSKVKILNGIYNINDRKINIMSVDESGLSKSRNRALKSATQDICIIADDDIVYEKNHISIIKKNHEIYKDVDIIVFQVLKNNGEAYKKYTNKQKKLSFRESLRVSSVEITFKRKNILDKKIVFDEKFGAGSEFNFGEENIFLKECLEKNLKILYVPKVIGKLDDSDSTWFTGFDERYFRNRGAVYYKLFGKKSWLYTIIFSVKKYKNYRGKVTFLQANKLMKEGIKKIMNEEKI